MANLSPALRIGILRGGPSPEYEVSIKTGGNVLNILSETHKPIDIFISKEGKWHVQGVEKSPDRILSQVDVIFNGLHGAYGEDGGVQQVLDSHSVPYTGSDRFASAMAMNKWLTKEKLKEAGVKTPIAVLVRREDSVVEKAKEIFNSIPHPLIVKPACGGSSIGLYIVRTYKELLAALESVLENHGSAVVEEYIAGKEATCAVIENFRGNKLYALPVVEIIPPEGQMFDYDAKYSGKSREICPGRFSEKDKKEIEKVAKIVHDKMDLKHYSRSDFIVSPKRGIYFLETNTLPGLTKESLLPKSLEAVGVSIKEFLHHVIDLAIHKTGVWI